MSDHLSERTHEALVEAEAVAHRLAHHYIGTEHLLVGLARVPGGAAGDGLGRCGLTADRLEAQVEELLGRGQHALAVRPPLTSSAALALERSRWEARQLGCARADTDHLLLALLRLPHSTAVTVLTGAGITADQVELALVDATASFVPRSVTGDGAGAGPAEPTGAGAPVAGGVAGGPPLAALPSSGGESAGGESAGGESAGGEGSVDRGVEPLAIVVARLSREVAELRVEVSRLRALLDPDPDPDAPPTIAGGAGDDLPA